MALQGTYMHKGAVCPEAYIKIEELFGGKIVDGWRAKARVYANKDMADLDKPNAYLTEFFIEAKGYIVGEWPYTRLYEQVKQREGFANFVDV